uniref:Uncharacterized protein n=1 Tax=Arundo donax TaxID=35708 RepID=A0A0A9FV79_ARUDO
MRIVLPPASGQRRGRRGAASLAAEAEGRRRQPRRRRAGAPQQRHGRRRRHGHGTHEPLQLGPGSLPPRRDRSRRAPSCAREQVGGTRVRGARRID